MTPQVMIDLETLGVGSKPVLLSLGATKFNETEILDRFHVGIDPTSCQRIGLQVDASTVMWWMDDDRAAGRQALLGLERHDIVSVLTGFAEWFGPDPLPVWGNGATADNVWLRNAFELAGVPCPWPYWMDRCHRTIKNLAPGVNIPREGTHHDALDDAIYQTAQWQAIMSALRMSGPTITPTGGPDPTALLAKAGRQFRMYEQQHLAKKTPESDAKADVNRQLAEEIEQLLAAVA